MTGLTVVKRTTTVVKGDGSVSVVKRPNVIKVTALAPSVTIPGFFPFSFVATEGQTTFVLAGVPLAVISIYINGTGQSQALGDFSISGKNIILNAPVDAGTLVAGVYVA